VLLLDEPLAGMGTAEAERMVELLLRLKPRHAMMLVEHDMDAVFTLADRLTVMVNGTVIASGSPPPSAPTAACRPPIWARTIDMATQPTPTCPTTPTTRWHRARAPTMCRCRQRTTPNC
jgi:energy-coupling factor transporter ATP-binding protein EcfA2